MPHKALESAERHAVHLQRLATQILNNLGLPAIDRARAIATRVLNEHGDLTSVTKLRSAVSEIRREVEASVISSMEKITDEMQTAAVYEAAFFASMIKKTMDLPLAVPSEDQIRAFVSRSIMTLEGGAVVTAAPWQEAARNFGSSIGSQIVGQVRAGYSSGDSTGEIVRRVRLAADGVQKRHIEALVRTGLQHHAMQAREALFEANANAIEGFVYVATLDNRTTTLCAGRDGKVYPQDGPRPEVPAHYNCRSMYLPLTPGMGGKLEGERVSIGAEKGKEAKEAFERRKGRADGKKVRYKGRNDKAFAPGQVSAKTTYEDFFLQQPVWWQESTMGKARAALVRKGGMKISQFNDLAGRPLTLAELRLIDSKAFGDAGL